MRLKKFRDIHTGLHVPGPSINCVFQVEKFRSDGTITYKGPRFNNIILDVGLDEWAVDGMEGGLLNRINVGTGSSTPATGQSGLDAFLASTNNIRSNARTYSIGPPVVATIVRQWQFNIGTCTGNLTEVGISADSNDKYLNRQLFRDDVGNPVTITVADDEGLRVTAEVSIYAPMDDMETVTGSFPVDGVARNYTMHFLADEFLKTDVGTYGCSILGIWGRNFVHVMPSYNAINTTTYYDRAKIGARSWTDYVLGSFNRTLTTVWAPDTLVGDINCLQTGLVYNGYPQSTCGALCFIFNLDTPINVLDTEELTIELKTSWGRYTP